MLRLRFLCERVGEWSYSLTVMRNKVSHIIRSVFGEVNWGFIIEPDLWRSTVLNNLFVALAIFNIRNAISVLAVERNVVLLFFEDHNDLCSNIIIPGAVVKIKAAFVIMFQ